MGAITIKDFLVEAEMFPYSQMNYNIQKEAGEIGLMQTYIESSRFIMEQSSEILEAAGGVKISEGYLMESVNTSKTFDIEEINMLEESVKEKIGNLGKNIKAVMKKVLDAIISFWKNLVGRGKKLKERTDALIADMRTIQATAITPEIKDEVKDLVDRAIETSKAPISGKSQAKLSLPRILLARDSTIENRLMAALSDKTIKCDITEDYKFALASSQLKEYFIQAKDVTLLGQGSGKLDKYVALNARNGIQIHVGEGEINSLISELESIRKQVEELDTVNRDNAQAAGKDYDSTAFGKVLADANKVASNSIKLYTAIQKYRETVVSGLGPIVSKLKKGGAAPKAKKEKDDEKE